MFYEINSNSDIIAKSQTKPITNNLVLQSNDDLDLDSYVFTVGQSSGEFISFITKKAKPTEVLIANYNKVKQQVVTLENAIAELAYGGAVK